MNNSASETSETLTDIALLEMGSPNPVSMWPDTTAWFLLFSIFFLLVALCFLRRVRAYRKDRWRREALILASQAHKSTRADEWFRLIKRVYLVHGDRQQLIHLTESDLLSLITTLNPQVSEALMQTHYQKDNCLPHASNDDLYRAFVLWVKALPPIC